MHELVPLVASHRHLTVEETKNSQMANYYSNWHLVKININTLVQLKFLKTNIYETEKLHTEQKKNW